eukprot:TRINITY_DN40424_c0_g1_i1.p1 TRINITY_DN40424_c0_g1~~TRINITY_DN40424_c0_g1_i1.p1  ORF type:complete len:679 (-),score=146.32 TRINITY_DN40424_c0_g1_i1:584-2530(-)
MTSSSRRRLVPKVEKQSLRRSAGIVCMALGVAGAGVAAVARTLQGGLRGFSMAANKMAFTSGCRQPFTRGRLAAPFLRERQALAAAPEAELMNTAQGSRGAAISLAEDKAWNMKRDWTDSDFQQGPDGNRKLLQSYEDQLVQRLQQSLEQQLGTASGGPVTRTGDDQNVLALALDNAGVITEATKTAVLNDPVVLGSALDIVGAYLKNYEVDKASRVMETIIPLCRTRGGGWLLKALNHLSTVRMKESRPEEALAMLEEMELLVAVTQDESERDEAWEYWETIYRNFGWTLSKLGRQEEGIKYIEKAIDVKERVGRSASWFDLWDLGRMKATIALRKNDADLILSSQGVVTRGLSLHSMDEPDDLVMRAKIWETLGETSFALGHLAEKASGLLDDASPNDVVNDQSARQHYENAVQSFTSAYQLFEETEGEFNPLTGGSAEALGWVFMKLGRDSEAKKYLLGAMETLSRQQSAWGDGDRASQEAPSALVSATLTIDRVLEVHKRTDDRAGLTKYFDAVERLCSNVCRRLDICKERQDSHLYERLVSTGSLVMVASGTADGMVRSQQLMKQFMWKDPGTMQAQLCSQVMNSLGPGGASSDAKALPGVLSDALQQMTASMPPEDARSAVAEALKEIEKMQATRRDQAAGG